MMEHDQGFHSGAKRMVDLQKRLPNGELGIYLVGKKFFRVEQQPKGNPAYVSDKKNVVTSFILPKHYGNLGFLAHNHLAGKFFLELELGDEIILLPEYGEFMNYRVTTVQKYRALQPRDPRSTFINLQTNRQCGAGEVFRQVYMGDEHMVLQTCLAKDNILEWGRVFYIAEPIE